MGETVGRSSPTTRRSARRRVRDQRSLSRRLALAGRHRGHAGARVRRESVGRSAATVFFTASRAHHAEIGGITPGSMPPFSKNLAEEGVLIRNFKLVDAGQSRIDELRALLAGGPYPSAGRGRQPGRHHRPGRRQPPRGARPAVGSSSDTRSPSSRPTCGTFRTRPNGRCGAALARLPRRARARSPTISTTARRSPSRSRSHGDAATIDFTGTGPVLAGNLNANRAIVTAAVMYVPAAA